MHTSNKAKLDKLDKTILQILLKDARTPYLEIARTCDVSGATVHIRVQKLEKMGIILGSRLIVDYKKLGLGLTAFLGIYLDRSKNFADLFDYINAIPEVAECNYTTGTYAMFVKVYCRDTDHLRDLLINKIQAIPNIRRTETFISLEEAIRKEPSLEQVFED